MNATAFLERLSEKGAKLEIVEGSLQYSGPDTVLTEKVREYIKTQKPCLLLELTEVAPEPRHECVECGAPTGGYWYCSQHDPFGEDDG